MADLRKLIIFSWFGPDPIWRNQFWKRAQHLCSHGYDFLLDTDLRRFEKRCRTIGVKCSIVPGGAKIHDYRPALGELYAHEIAGYDFWGHTDYDVVFGRAERFADHRLDGCDIQTDNVYDYLCGPWTLYRVGATESLFRLQPDWKERLEEPAVSGWVETSFTDIAKANARVDLSFSHAYEQPELLAAQGPQLYHGAREISFFHFRRTKQWPEMVA